MLCSEKPTAVFKLYQTSSRSSLLLMPKFKKEFNKSNSFIFNSSKIINFSTANNINYSSCSLQSFKTNVKRLLMSRQNVSIKNDPNWLPNNISLFSDVRMDWKYGTTNYYNLQLNYGLLFSVQIDCQISCLYESVD